MDDRVAGPHRPAHRCRTCGGTGRLPGIVKTTNRGSGMGSSAGPCPDCDGIGVQVPDDPEDRQPPSRSAKESAGQYRHSEKY